MLSSILFSYPARLIVKINRVLTLYSLVFWLCGVSSVSFADALDEYTVKIALVRNFAVFTEWPESAFVNSPDTMNLCILGDNVVQEAFLQLKNKSVSGRVLNIIDINKNTNLSSCHLVFIGGRDRVQLSQVHSATYGKPILTIDDMTGINSYTGVVNLQAVDGKMRLNVNIEMAKKAQLKISSRLLKLAVIVSAETGIE